MSTTKIAFALGLAATTVMSLVATAPASASPGRADQVPVRSGYYGYADATDPDMVGFAVRNRKIIDPRFAIEIECRHSDGTSQPVAYGVTQSDPDRKFRIPRNGNGRVSWRLPEDSSLVPDAKVFMGFTFHRQRPVQVAIEVEAEHSETDPATGDRWTSTCYGVRPFVLSRGRLPRR